MLGFIEFIIMGGVIGWLSSMIMRRDAAMGTVTNIIVGIIGSFIGNSALAFLPGGGTFGAWPPEWSESALNQSDRPPSIASAWARQRRSPTFVLAESHRSMRTLRPSA